MHPFGGSTICPRCSKVVYAAEQVMGPGRKIFHKSCLTCYSCKRRLDSFSLVEHNEEPYCRPCHVREFGTRDLRSANISPQLSPQARSRTNTAATASSPPAAQPVLEVGADDSMETDSSPDPAAQQPHSPATPAEESADQLSDIAASPPKRFIAFEGAGKGTRSLSPQSTGGHYTHQTPQVLTASMTGGMFSSPQRAGRTKTFGSASPTCPRCGKAVYFAEQVNAIGKKWHKACLTCTACNKRLDSSTLLDHGDEPYCKACHTRNFGTRDLRSANLSPTTIR